MALAERGLIAVSDLIKIKIGLSIWDLLYLWVIAPKVDKKIKKHFGEKTDTGQIEAAGSGVDGMEPGKEEKDQAT